MSNIVLLRKPQHPPIVEVSDNLVALTERVGAIASDAAMLDFDPEAKISLMRSLVGAVTALGKAQHAMELSALRRSMLASEA